MAKLNYSLTRNNIIIGNPEGDNIVEHLILSAIYYIYTCRIREAPPRVEGYIMQIRETQKIELQRAQESQKLALFHKRWARLNL